MPPRNGHRQSLGGPLPGEGRHPVGGCSGTAQSLITAGELFGQHTFGSLDPHLRCGAAEGAGQQALEPVQRGEPPFFLPAGGDGEVLDRVGGEPVSPGRTGGFGLPVTVCAVGARPRVVGAERVVFSCGRHQPTAPSICSSISRFSSRAYSMGSSRAIGSTKPRTIIAIASASSIPRDIR